MTASSQHQVYDTHGYKFTQESIERAFDGHRDAGRIRSWTKNERPGLRFTRWYPMYTVTTVNGITMNLATVHEAFAFALGLASATIAFEKRDAEELEALMAEERARAERLDAQHEREDAATATIPCATCGAKPGEKCTRIPLDDTPYAAHPHAARLDALNGQRDRNLLSTGQAVIPR